MRFSSHAMIAGLTLAVLAVPVGAAHANLITNGDFETGQLSAGGYSYISGTRDSWTYVQSSTYGGGILINQGGGGGPWINNTQTGHSGSQVVGIEGLGSVTQTFTATITGAYAVNWVDAGRSYSTSVGNQTYIAKVYDNTTSATSASATLSTTSGSVFKSEVLYVSLTAGDSYTLSFVGQDSTDQTALLDDVKVDLPEPATLALLAVGFAALVFVRRRTAA